MNNAATVLQHHDGFECCLVAPGIMLRVVGNRFGFLDAEIRVVNNSDIEMGSQHSFGRLEHNLIHSFFAVFRNPEFIGFHGMIYILRPAGPSPISEGITSSFQDF